MHWKACRLFIGCVPGDSNSGELLKLLNCYAKVVSINLVMKKTKSYDFEASYCMGYGFVKCASIEDSKALVASAHLIRYRGRQITVKEYKNGMNLKKEKSQLKSKRIFFGGVHHLLDEKDIRPMFEQFGHLDSFYIINSNQSFKYGFLVYNSPRAAELAIRQLHGFLLFGIRLRVELSLGKNAKTPVTGADRSSIAEVYSEDADVKQHAASALQTMNELRSELETVSPSSGRKAYRFINSHINHSNDNIRFNIFF